jgi:alpha-glucosidase
MSWTTTLHHDHTPFYLSQLEASVGDTVRVRLRVPKDLKLESVLLADLRSGERHTTPMKRITVNTQPDFAFYEADLELHARTVRYKFWLQTSDDSVQFCAKGATRANPSFRDWFQFVCDVHRPNWLDDRVFYQIFPDRFKNGDPSNDVQTGEYTYNGKPVVKKEWHELPTRAGNVFEHWGGDLEGIRQGLDYLEALGVNGIYLNPIFTSPSNHRYDTENYLEVDPHLGGEDALRRLLDEAHARGFKIVLDGVFNHTGDRLEAFKRARENHAERELYTWLPNGKYEAFFGVPTLPKLDFASPVTYERFLEAPDSPVRHWLRFGVDGWRLDVAHMMGARGIDADNLKVHRHLRAAARSENPEAWIFGERFWDAEAALQGPNDALSSDGGGEDGVMNYHGFTLPVTDWLAGVTILEKPVQLETAEMTELVQERYRVLPPLARLSQYNLIGSHDIPRPLERLKGDSSKLSAAFTLLMGFPGVPGIYYGDEIGLMGGHDPFCRAPFPWDETQWDTGLLETVKKLVKARRSSLALRQGSLVWLTHTQDSIAFARVFTHADGRVESAIVAATRQTGETLSLDVTGLSNLEWTNSVNGEVVTARDGQLEVVVSSDGVLLI